MAVKANHELPTLTYTGWQMSDQLLKNIGGVEDLRSGREGEGNRMMVKPYYYIEIPHSSTLAFSTCFGLYSKCEKWPFAKLIPWWRYLETLFIVDMKTGKLIFWLVTWEFALFVWRQSVHNDVLFSRCVILCTGGWKPKFCWWGREDTWYTYN